MKIAICDDCQAGREYLKSLLEKYESESTQRIEMKEYDSGRSCAGTRKCFSALLEQVDLEVSWGNRKLESRLEGIQKSRLLLNRVNEALTVLKKKPENGERMYRLIYPV